MTTMPTDTYYRGYRLTQVRKGTPTETIQIRQMGDPELIALVPTLERAKAEVDSYHTDVKDGGLVR